MSITTEITNQGFLIAGQCLGMYESLDSIVPWKRIEESTQTLGVHNDQYTIEAGRIVADTKTCMLDAADSYFSTKQSVYEMCAVVLPLIAVYKTLFAKCDTSNFPTQKTILLKVIDDGMVKMTEAHVNLDKCVTNFNLAVKKLTLLNTKLTSDLDRSRYDGIRMQLQKAIADIRSARSKLDVDIEIIRHRNDGHTQTSESLDMNQFHNGIIDSVNDFARQCEGFKRKHVTENNFSSS